MYDKNLTGNQLIYDKKNYQKLIYNPITDTKYNKTFNSCPFGNLSDLQSVGESYISFAQSALDIGRGFFFFFFFFFAQSSGGSRGGSRGSFKPPSPPPFYISYENEIIWSQ